MKLGKVIEWSRESDHLLLRMESAVLGVSFFGDDIVRLRLCWGNALQDEDTYVLAGNCGSAGMPPCSKNFSVFEAEDQLTLESGDIRLELGLDPLAAKVFTKGGRLLAATPASGLGYFTKDETVAQFLVKPDEKIYGLGQDPMGRLDHRNSERRMWNEWDAARRSGNGGIPFLMSSSGYGLLLNSSWASRFAIGRAEMAETGLKRARGMAPAPWPWDKSAGENHPDMMSIHLLKGHMDLFIICRESFDDIQRAYVDLTGHPPMLPRWAFGFIQCKNRYRSQEELLSIARGYRERKIPCDVLVIDWLWFREFGDLEWFRADWPDPQGMLKELSDMDFHVMQAQHPFVEKNSLKYKTFLKSNFMNKVPEGARPTFDHSNPQAREGWWDEIKRLYADGIRAYWTDMGELEEHPVGTMSSLGPRERVHNIYSTLWTKGLYEGQRRDFKERVFSLPRTAYAGIQRYSAALWSGDVDASWEVLRDQVVIGQGVCLSGQQYWTTDIGGFITDERFSPELYIRWLQWGVFCPIFRTHGTRPGNEAWSFGAEAERILTKFIRLRYRLLPYIYSCARAVTEKGTPMMRAMCMDYADDSTAAEQTTQFMFGPALLVAPVLEEGARSRRVYLPKGSWYDFHTGEKLDGGQWVEAPAPLDLIPLFVKAGSLIPLGPEIEHTMEGLPGKLEIHAYAGKASTFELYEDDGLTYDYEKGAYAKTLISLDDSGKASIGPVEGKKELIPEDRTYDIVLHNGSGACRVSCRASDGASMAGDGAGAGGQEAVPEADPVSGDAGLGSASLSGSGPSGSALGDPDPGDSSFRDYVNQVDAFDLDSNLSPDGRLMLHLSCRNACLCEMELQATLKVPRGWKITGSSAGLSGSEAKTLAARVKETAYLYWELHPADIALPLEAECSVDIEAKHGERSINLKRRLGIGSGFATRWEAVGHFDNLEDDGLGRVLPPESDPDAPHFEEDGRLLGWCRNPSREFNCFGYVDFRELIPGDIKDNKGVAYARCRVWADQDTDAYVQLAADPTIKLWVNREPVFESDSIILDRILDKPVPLKKGWNECLIKAALAAEKPYSGREYGFRFRFVDVAGKPLKKLLYKP